MSHCACLSHVALSSCLLQVRTFWKCIKAGKGDEASEQRNPYAGTPSQSTAQIPAEGKKVFYICPIQLLHPKGKGIQIMVGWRGKAGGVLEFWMKSNLSFSFALRMLRLAVFVFFLGLAAAQKGKAIESGSAIGSGKKTQFLNCSYEIKFQ